LNADKLLTAGFKPKYNIEYAMKEIIEAFEFGRLKDEDGCYNVRTMKRLRSLS